MHLKKSHKMTVLLDPEEFGRFDAYCTALGFKKSTLIARLIREHLDAARFVVDPARPSSGEAPRVRRGRR